MIPVYNQFMSYPSSIASPALLDLRPSCPSRPIMTLAETPLNTTWRVLRIKSTEAAPERTGQLEELGFLPGELVAVLARGFPGHDPLVVRVGLSTFALRRDEALSVLLEMKDAPFDA
jgi:ferrous iron transport protein A